MQALGVINFNFLYMDEYGTYNFEFHHNNWDAIQYCENSGSFGLNRATNVKGRVHVGHRFGHLGSCDWWYLQIQLQQLACNHNS